MLEDGARASSAGLCASRAGRSSRAKIRCRSNDLIREPANWRCRITSVRAVNPADLEEYQTVYASHKRRDRGADCRAAFHRRGCSTRWPTRACARAIVTLHIGPGTFAPVRADRGRAAFDGSRVVHDSARDHRPRSSMRGASAAA